MSAKELPTPEEMQAMAEVDLKNIDTSIIHVPHRIIHKTIVIRK